MFTSFADRSTCARQGLNHLQGVRSQVPYGTWRNTPWKWWIYQLSLPRRCPFRLPFEMLIKGSAKLVLYLLNFLLLAIVLKGFLAPPPVKAACYCSNPQPEAGGWCKCTSTPPSSATFCTTEQGVEVCCESEFEKNTYWSRINPICGSAVETVPYCSYRRGFEPDGTEFFHNDVTCWGTEWSLDPGTPDLPDETNGQLRDWNQTILYNGFNSVERDPTGNAGRVAHIHTCQSDLYCCGSTITDSDGNNVSACAGYVPQASSCTPQNTSITPPDWCANVPSPRDRSWSCQDENDPEFHTYRPYPAEPCNKQATELALFCGNTLNLTDGFGIEKRYTISGGTIGADYFYTDDPQCADKVNWCSVDSPNYSCTDNGDGTETCRFLIQDRNVDFWVDLQGAYLPIMGNTELVTNSEPGNEEDSLTDPQKVNEYVSWYLNGAKFNPVEYGALSKDDENKFNETMINFSGPLRKLLSHRNQRDIIELETLDAYRSSSETNEDAQIRHNQIIGCVGNVIRSLVPPTLEPVGIWGKILKCYHEGHTKSKIRAGDYFQYADEDQIPPKENTTRQQAAGSLNPDQWYIDDNGNYDFLKWYRDYQRWRGRLCLGIFSFLPGFIRDLMPDLLQDLTFCFNNPLDPDYMGNLYFTVPMSSTEDRIGLVDVERANIFPHPNRSERVTDFRVIDQSVNTDPADLFFAHMQETSELADILQRTFAPCPANRFDIEGNPRCEFFERDSSLVTPVTSVEPPEWCDVTDVRSNPGDNLHADQLSGQLIYTSEVSCQFTIPGEGRFCESIGASCRPVSSGQMCETYYGQLDCGIEGGTQTYCANGCSSLPYNPSGPCMRAGYGCYPRNWNERGSCTLVYDEEPSSCNDSGLICGACSQPTDDASLVQECNVAVFASLETQTKTPKADEVWSRLVAGEKGVFQKFYPKIGANTPIKEICDIPASSPVSFTSPWLDSVGNPASGRTQPELYFPHIGGIQQYFLKGIQTALRPQGFGEPQPSYECPKLGANLPSPSEECIGRTIAEYMDGVITTAGDLTHIRFTSPAWNMTNAIDARISDFWYNNATSIGRLYAIAGNAYNTDWQTPSGREGTVTNFVNDFLSSTLIGGTELPVIITETGITENGGSRERWVNEMHAVQNSSRMLGALIFNAFNAADDAAWSAFWNRIGLQGILDTCGRNCSYLGANSAVFYTRGEGFYNDAASFGMGYSLEIDITGPNGQTTTQAVKWALDRGMTPIIRVGTAVSDGPRADDYGNYLRQLDQELTNSGYGSNQIVLAIAGPNEPQSEYWASRECFFE